MIVRLLAPVLLFTLATGCAPQAIRVSVPNGAIDLDQFLASHRLPDEGGIRVDQIGRAEGASYHLVQVLGSERPHRHETHDLTVLVLRGHGVLTRLAGATPLAQGDAAVVPRGEPHWFASEGAFPAIALVVFAPPLDAPDAVPLEER
jgi:mannose-6-phosphate isomerase-like protein (cupin superfamily)